MRKDFINTVILFKRENETASFEEFLADSFPENISLGPDGSVDWIDKRVLNEEWQGTFETVKKDDALFPLEGPPGEEHEQKVQPRGLSKTWLQLYQFVSEAVHHPITAGSAALVESKTASASFLQNVRDGTNSAIASVTQSISELKEKWIPIEDIQEVECTSGSIQGTEMLDTRFRIHTRDGMIHYLEAESPELSSQYQALLVQCMAASRRTQILTGGQTHSGLRALRLLRTPAPPDSLAVSATTASPSSTSA